jgi:hypothetical protein
MLKRSLVGQVEKVYEESHFSNQIAIMNQFLKSNDKIDSINFRSLELFNASNHNQREEGGDDRKKFRREPTNETIHFLS